MARSIRWQIQFTSLAGKDCHVDIYCDGWSGGVTQLTGTDSPFEYKEDDSKDLLHFVRYKTGYIRFWEKLNEDWSQVYPDSLTARYVKAYYADALVFTGYLQCQEFGNEWVAAPREIQIPVISPLGLLESFKFGIPSTPGLVSLGSLMEEVIEKLDADYTSVVCPSTGYEPWSCSMLSTICVPFNPSFKHSDERSELYEPKTLLYFIEGICAWLGVIVHDSPEAIIFHRLYESDYGLVVFPGMSASHFSNHTWFLPSYYEYRDNSATTSMLQPLKAIEIKADGDVPHQQLDPARMKFRKLGTYIAEGRTLQYALMTTIDPEVNGVELGYNNTNDIYLGTATGLMGLAIGGTWYENLGSASYIQLCTENRLLTSIISMKFCELATVRKTFMLKIKVSRGNSDVKANSLANIWASGYTSFYLYLKVWQNGKCCDIFNNSWRSSDVYNIVRVDGTSGYINAVCSGNQRKEWKSALFFSTQTTDTDAVFSPVEVSLHVINVSEGDSNYQFNTAPNTGKDVLRFDNIELGDLYATVQYNYETTNYYKTSRRIEGRGIGEKTLAVHFQNYPTMLCNHHLGSGGSISVDPESLYAHMFRPQVFKKIRAVPTPTHPNITPTSRVADYMENGETWAIISESLNMKDDEYTLLLYKKN